MRYAKPRKPIHLRESIWEQEKRLRIEARELSKKFSENNKK